jgi:DNA-binding NarL/FixJ family response regulator
VDFELVGIASHSLEALQIAIDKQPGVLLIDPMMRDGLGLAVLAQVTARIPQTKIVILTAIIETTLDMQLRALGISHILMKGVSRPDLLAELRSAGGL